MTNAEAYIGDEDLIYQFIDEFNEFACEQDCDFKYHYLKETLVKFFKQERKPTLTEDERVILRNLKKKYKYIGKDGTTLYVTELPLKNSYDTEENFYLFNHLFQFIKERRRI